MLRAHSRRLSTILHGADVLVACGIFLLLVSRPGAVTAPFSAEVSLRLAATALLGAVAWPMLLDLFGLYDSQRRSTTSAILGRILAAGLIATALLCAVTWLARAPVAPTFPLLCGLGQTAGFLAARLGLISGLHMLRRLGRNYRNVLVVGTGPRALDVVRTIERNPQWGIRLVGFLDEVDGPVHPGLPVAKIHKLIDTPDLLRDEVIDEVVIAVPRSLFAAVSPVVAACAEAGVPVTLPSDLFGDYLPPPRPARFDTLPALTFAPVHHSRTSLAVKRLVDIVGASALLLISWPAMLVAALAIRSGSSGPVLFRQERCGLYGRRFEMLKFRTMEVDAEARRAELLELNEMDGPVFKLREDPRITRVGRLLRRWSLDELPQLWNVLMGDMSLVGPRPPLPEEVAQYAIFERRRLSMRPGLTCLWQVMGRNSIGFAEWVKLDLHYIDNWSIATDLRILLSTIPTVIRGDGH